MSGSPADTVRAQFAAFADGLDAVVEYWHPDIEWRAVEGAADDVGVMRGHDALRGYYAEWLESLEGLRAEVTDVLAEVGDRVAVALRNHGRGRASGVPIEGRYYVVCTVEDGRIVSGREYASAREAVDALSPS